MNAIGAKTACSQEKQIQKAVRHQTNSGEILQDTDDATQILKRGLMKSYEDG